MCVQRFDDSRNSAIHITYRISLRSSSMPEPRDPLLKVLTDFCLLTLRLTALLKEFFCVCPPAGAVQRLATKERLAERLSWESAARRGNRVM